MKKLLLQVIGVGIVVAAIGLGGVKLMKPTYTDRPVPSLPAGDKAPSKEFLEQWFYYARLRDEIKQIQADKELQRKIDQLNGMGSRLLPQVPAGYTWNEDTLSFRPIPAPPPLQTTPAAPPAKK